MHFRMHHKQTAWLSAVNRLKIVVNSLEIASIESWHHALQQQEDSHCRKTDSVHVVHYQHGC